MNEITAHLLEGFPAAPPMDGRRDLRARRVLTTRPEIDPYRTEELHQRARIVGLLRLALFVLFVSLVLLLPGVTVARQR